MSLLDKIFLLWILGEYFRMVIEVQTRIRTRFQRLDRARFMWCFEPFRLPPSLKTIIINLKTNFRMIQLRDNKTDFFPYKILIYCDRFFLREGCIALAALVSKTSWVSLSQYKGLMFPMRVDFTAETVINKSYKIDPAKLECFERCNVNNTMF